MAYVKIKNKESGAIKEIIQLAQETPIADLGELFEAKDVENALQELGLKIEQQQISLEELELLKELYDTIVKKIRDINKDISNLEDDIDRIDDDINEIEERLDTFQPDLGIDKETIEELIENHIGIDYDALKEIIEAYLNGDLSGGGGTGAVSPTIESETPKENVVEENSDFELNIFFKTPNLGNGKLYITVNNAEIDYYPTLNSGDNTIVIAKKYLTKTSNTISVYAKDRMGVTSNKLAFKVISGAIILTSPFDYTVDYVVGQNILFPFYTTSEMTGTITLHMTIDGVAIDPIDCANGYNSLYLNTYIQGVGSHAVSMYAQINTTLTGAVYRSKVMNFNVVISSSSQLTLSTSTLNGEQFKYGDAIQIGYRVSKLGSENFTITFYLDGIQARQTIVPTGSYYWTLVGGTVAMGKHEITIKAEGTSGDSAELVFNIEVVQGDFVPISIVKGGLTCLLDSTGYSNEMTNRTVWEDKSGKGNHGELINFNFSTNGWNPTLAEFTPSEDDPNTSILTNVTYNGLVCNNDSYVRIPYKPFVNNIINGFTMEIVYTPEHSGNNKARVLEYADIDAPYTGVYVDIEEMNIKSESETTAGMVELDYESGEIQCDFVVDRENKMCRMYVNGIVSRYWMLSDTGAEMESFAIDNDYIYLNFSAISEDFCGGTNVIRKFICYERALSHEEVVNNYIANQPTVAKMQEIYNWCYNTQIPKLQIYGDISNISSTIPAYVRIKYESTNEELYGSSFDMESANSPIYLQGTSSLGYARKNYRFVLIDSNGQEYFHDMFPGNSLPESTYTTK